MAAEKIGIKVSNFGAGGKDAEAGHGVAQRDRAKDQRIGLHTAIEPRPGGRRGGTQAVKKRGKKRALLGDAQNRGLHCGGVQIAEVDLKAGRTAFGRVAVQGQGQARSSLHRSVGKGNRVPSDDAAAQVQRGLGNFHMAGEEIRSPVGVAHGHSTAEAVRGLGGGFNGCRCRNGCIRG